MKIKLPVEQDAPFDSSTSAVTLMVKGKSLGTTGLRDFSARAPERNTHTHTGTVVFRKEVQRYSMEVESL